MAFKTAEVSSESVPRSRRKEREKTKEYRFRETEAVRASAMEGVVAWRMSSAFEGVSTVGVETGAGAGAGAEAEVEGVWMARAMGDGVGGIVALPTRTRETACAELLAWKMSVAL